MIGMLKNGWFEIVPKCAQYYFINSMYSVFNIWPLCFLSKPPYLKTYVFFRGWCLSKVLAVCRGPSNLWSPGCKIRYLGFNGSILLKTPQKGKIHFCKNSFVGANLTTFQSHRVTFFTHRLEAQASVAHEMLRSIPARAKQIIMDGDFSGTDLVRLDSDIHRPSFRDRVCQKWFW